jgi:hypothetical protein
MTSIISPTLYARQLATAAQQDLKSANDNLTTPVPFDGIPGDKGGSKVAPTILPPELVHRAALSAAAHAVQKIDAALALGSTDSLSRQVLSAFASAKTQAEAGIAELSGTIDLPLNVHHVALQFDGASMWLGVARNLLSLGHGTDEPPTKWHVQLPSPDSEIQ